MVLPYLDNIIVLDFRHKKDQVQQPPYVWAVLCTSFLVGFQVDDSFLPEKDC